MQRADHLEKSMIFGKIEAGVGDDRAQDGWMDHWLNMSLSKLQEMVEDKKAWHAAVHGVSELDMNEWLNKGGVFSNMIYWKLL